MNYVWHPLILRGTGGLLGMIPNYIHTWGFKHTGMGWRSQQTLNCKGDEYLRTWKKIHHRERKTSCGETDSAMGLSIEGDKHFISHSVWLWVWPVGAQAPGSVYAAWRRGCACLTTGDPDGSNRVCHWAEDRWALAPGRGSRGHWAVVSSPSDWRWVAGSGVWPWRMGRMVLSSWGGQLTCKHWFASPHPQRGTASSQVW